MIHKDIIDSEGIKRRVALPEGIDDLDPLEGMVVSFDPDRLYGDMPVEFRQKLYNALWDQGLIMPCDYLQPGASDKYKRALLLMVKHDFFSMLDLAKEVCKP